MFTNWLTGTSGTQASSNSATNINNNEQLVKNSATLTTNNILSTAPDVVLEVGHTPDTVRFMAHSSVLGMHSGYLRSAVRLDEQHNAANAVNNMIIYLGNVTAEQFAPLLTYMYTGYLDLNVENIFGVLLATHVLHMPRALEICRAFLARAQTNGYLANNLGNILPTTSSPLLLVANTSPAGNKIIRPIPSKPFGYLPAPIAETPTTIGQHLALQLNAIKNLHQQQEIINFESAQQQLQQQPLQQPPHNNIKETLIDENSCSSESQNGEEIDVDRSSSIASNDDHTNKILNRTEQTQINAIDEEDQEVFIDSNSSNTTDVEDTTITKINTKSTTIVKTISISNMENTINVKSKIKNTNSKNIRRRKYFTEKSSNNNKKRIVKNLVVGGLQVAKAPIPASQLEPIESNSSKVIIDIASCDGPVRFRRILNTAYGHKPDAYVVPAACTIERTQQSVSLSFQQQMARTIRQKAEESENKDSLSKIKGTGNAANNEIYVCVYCKHTFKSQYCYQKHAKRHLNPLSLNCARATSSSGEQLITAIKQNYDDDDDDDKDNDNDNDVEEAAVSLKTQLPLNNNTNNNNNNNNKNNMAKKLLSGKVGVTAAAQLLLRREVRPLDMNVQYYPCKTCGSKFPSYYFVHKHRKLCHAEEEAGTAAVTTNSGATSSTTTTTAATATTTTIDLNSTQNCTNILEKNLK